MPNQHLLIKEGLVILTILTKNSHCGTQILSYIRYDKEKKRDCQTKHLTTKHSQLSLHNIQYSTVSLIVKAYCTNLTSLQIEPISYC